MVDSEAVMAAMVVAMVAVEGTAAVQAKEDQAGHFRAVGTVCNDEVYVHDSFFAIIR